MRYKNHAELEIERMQRIGNALAAAKRRGVCSHGWTQGQPGAGDGPVQCLDCDARFPDQAAAHAAHKAVISSLL